MDQLTNIFKVLSDQTRLRAVVLLYKEELCVCELEGVLELSQPKISKSLSKLRDLNLVEDERKEKFVFYTLKKDNQILNRIIQGILENLEEYPQIQEDIDRLGEKEKYLNKCNPLSIL
ncbi:ArsR/SmtB family transcription factor [Gudongella sp. DL1XJH-153]|uniref:ArsR/SmtB family transcription factor n=1 Tax=Gudongella sp. DL1XJH-153 TaxID=3409804 RepID=UPI003BB6D1C8